MAIRFADRVKVRSQSFGTGDFNLDQTVPGFQGFEAIGSGNQTYYCITDAIGNWEIGLGTYDQDSTQQTLTRDSVLDSSAGGIKINFPRGGKTVFVTTPSSISQTVADSVLNTLAGPKGDKGDPGVSLTYEQSAQFSIDGALLRLEGSDSSTADVKLANGDNVSIERTDAGTITISATSSLSSRSLAGVATGAFENGSTVSAVIDGFKGYTILKIQVSHAARIRIYADTASRAADLNRPEGIAPSPASGLIHEMISTGSEIRKLSPGVIGYNDEPVVTDSIPISVTNKSGTIANITVTLTLLRLEQ